MRVEGWMDIEAVIPLEEGIEEKVWEPFRHRVLTFTFNLGSRLEECICLEYWSFLSSNWWVFLRSLGFPVMVFPLF